MDNGDIFLLDRSRFPKPAQFASGRVLFGHERHSAGFAVEAVNEMRPDTLTQMQAHPTNQTRSSIALRRMANQTSRLVDDQQVGVFVENVQSSFQSHSAQPKMWVSQAWQELKAKSKGSREATVTRF
jgi:hypothetical protein